MSRLRSTGLLGLLAELRRRHVVRVAAAYAAVAFVVLQAAEIVVGAFGLGDAPLRLLILLAALGFPLTVCLAWVYELTPAGLRTMEDLDREAGFQGTTGRLLPRLALLVLTVVSVGAGALWAVRSTAPASADPAVAAGGPVRPVADGEAGSIRSLAVLPLEGYAEEGDATAFAAGMHEAVISQLSQLGTFRVVSRTSVVQFDREGKSAPEIGHTLGVEGIVEGSVLRAGGRVRISAALVHAAADRTLWADEYEGDLSDVIALQRDVARAIAAAIQGELEGTTVVAAVGPDEAPGVGPVAPVALPAVHEAYLMGRMEQEKDSPDAHRLAIRHFQEALALDPDFAPAWAGLAGSRILMATLDSTLRDAALDSARRAVERAVALDPSSAEALDLMALVVESREEVASAGAVVAGGRGPLPRPLTPPVALREPAGVRRGAGVRPLGEAEPAVAPTPPDLGYLSEMGRRIAASVAHRQALETGAAVALVDAARRLEAAGRGEQALGLLDRAVRDHGSHLPAWEALEHAHAVRGNLEAVAELRGRRAERPGSDERERTTTREVVRAIREDGLRGYWTARLAELEARRRDGQEVPAGSFARAQAALGEVEDAVASLQEAAERGEEVLLTLLVDPVWDPLRDDPRFGRLLGRSGLPGPAPAGRRPGGGDQSD